MPIRIKRKKNSEHFSGSRYDRARSGWRRTIEGGGCRKAIGESQIENGEIPKNLPAFQELVII
jgi:hypothetical protein